MLIEKTIAIKTAEAICKLYKTEIAVEKVSIEKTNPIYRETGDVTVLVFPFAKISRKSPDITANEIGQYLKDEIPQIKSFSVIKGFLNLLIDDSYWSNYLRITDTSNYGVSKEKRTEKILVEYSSPNTNKPLHLGHIRNNLLGWSVAEILKANGYDVIKTTLVNDRGIHICKSMLAWQKWGKGETPESSGLKGDLLVGKYYVLFDKYYKEEIKALTDKGISEEDAAKQAPLIIEAQEMLRKWEVGDKDTIALWEIMNSWVYKGFDLTYKMLGIDFDKTEYESDTYLLGKKIVEEGVKKKEVIKKDDDSVWADLTNEGLDEKLLLRADGTSVYMTQDIGTAQLRYDEHQPEKLIYVVGNEQNYHFDVLKLVLKKLGRDWSDKIYHLSYGMVELPEGKMKSREGTVVDADDLIAEMIETAKQTTEELGKTDELNKEEASKLFRMIGLGALKYFILKVDPKKNMLFNPKESIDFNGNTGPFIQYTHARICSVLRKANQSGVKWNSADINISELLPKEKNIIKLIYDYPAIVKEAGASYSPALIANYIYELAKEYNGFYQEIPILKEEKKEQVSFRLVLSEYTAVVIKSAMQILGIEVPEKM
ncbi:MAG: arginine--tRNA ligase [Bacteroidales bacterium]